MKTPHVHAAMIKEWAEDTSRVVEYWSTSYDGWFIDIDPAWFEKTKYRFLHKHQDLIDQKAARPELVIETDLGKFGWHGIENCAWQEKYEYRLVEPRHKHQDLIDRKKERPELIVETKSDDAWVPIGEAVMWFKDSEYRLVEPPKKKVKMWQWVLKYVNSGQIILSSEFYKNLKDLEGNYKVIQRADWTEISIEVDE